MKLVYLSTMLTDSRIHGSAGAAGGNLGVAFTCVTCCVQFNDGDAQRLHYKSEWHRYNLKRKVASLPPISESAFNDKSAKLTTLAKPEQASSVLRCSACNKTFSSENSLQSHLESKKHKEALNRHNRNSLNSTVSSTLASPLVNGSDVIQRVVKTKRTPKLSESQASKKSKLVAIRAAKAKVMEEEEEFDDDDSDDGGWETDENEEDEDITEAEMEKISDEDLGWGDGEAIPKFTCLFCKSVLDSTEANVAHMSSNHSFFIPDLEFLIDLDGLLTYLGEKVGCGFICLWCNEKGKAFHSVEAVQTHMKDKGHTKMFHEGDALLEYSDFYDYRPSYPDYDSDKVQDTDMEVETGSQDDEVEVEALDGDGYQLVLPSGATVGHRSLLRYYKQSLNPRFHNAVVCKQRVAVQKLMSQYKALGWNGSCGEAAKLKAKDIDFAYKAFHKRHMQLGIKANKMQHHYREQVMF